MSSFAVTEPALLDTNILVYAVDAQSAYHAACRPLLLQAADNHSSEPLCVTPQVLAEFFAVVTNARRVRNPRAPDEAARAVDQIMTLPNLTVLPIPVDIFSRWVSLVRTHRLSGSRVFDAQLVATMLANGVRRIYTLDRAHFECFPDIEVVSPRLPPETGDNDMQA